MKDLSDRQLKFYLDFFYDRMCRRDKSFIVSLKDAFEMPDKTLIRLENQYNALVLELRRREAQNVSYSHQSDYNATVVLSAKKTGFLGPQ